MWRSILGIVAGFFVGGIVAFLIELPGMIWYPLPPGTDMSNMEAIKSHMANAPLWAIAGVAIAWTIAPLVAAWIAAVIARRAPIIHGMIIGGLFFLADMANVLSFSHPTWLVAIGAIVPFVSGWLGASLAARMFPPAAAGPKPYDMRQRNMAC